MREWRVGVCDRPLSKHGKRLKPIAYTLWFSSEWPNICTHKVKAETGKEAKEIAINDHLDHCEYDPAVSDTW